jgi:hypothetical protein
MHVFAVMPLHVEHPLKHGGGEGGGGVGGGGFGGGNGGGGALIEGAFTNVRLVSAVSP